MERRLAIVTLVVLSAVGAELLAAYDDSTGRPGEPAVAVVFFAFLYGCPALLIRDLACRRELGWSGIVLLAAAAGLLQAGVVDQSLFAREYGDVRGWDDMVEPTWIAPLGFSVYATQSFLVGHVVFSFCAPIAVVDGLFPRLADRPWLGRRGTVVALALWLLVAVAIVLDERHATAVQAVAAGALIVALVVLALRPRAPSRRPGVNPARAAAAGFAVATLHALLPASWAGTAAALLLVALAAVVVARHTWDLRAAAALATGALLSRGVLAFTSFPLVGEEVAAGPKYAHNAVMLLLVAAIGCAACRVPTPSR